MDIISSPKIDARTVSFCRIRPVKMPQYSSTGACGIDFFVPEDWNEGKDFRLAPHARVLIPSGIKTILPTGTGLLAINKSGVSSKKGLARMAELIDWDYQGEIHISLVNTSEETVTIAPGDKIIQFIHIQLPQAIIHEVSPEEYAQVPPTERLAGGFGSTDKK